MSGRPTCLNDQCFIYVKWARSQLTTSETDNSEDFVEHVVVDFQRKKKDAKRGEIPAHPAEDWDAIGLNPNAMAADLYANGSVKSTSAR